MVVLQKIKLGDAEMVCNCMQVVKLKIQISVHELVKVKECDFSDPFQRTDDITTFVFEKLSYNIGWPWGGYKNILPEMLTILPESKTRVMLLASRAIYSCIPRKRAIQYYYCYYYYSYGALCVILLSNDRGWLPAAILSSHESESLWDVATYSN